MASIVALAVSGAATVAGESLEQRVQRYWTARSINDVHTVYGLESAAQPGGWLTPDKYQQLGGLPVREVKIVETKIEGDNATVTLQGQVAVGTLGWMPQTLTEDWVLIEGEWYHQTPQR
ncbi:MAG: hypothetical protein P9F19_14665 [Candidatus Contendobacter sp.]|nr:hypothetical protein [Candidatus Contendobacter sp.]MDG4558615.1 hypothetical protein [Candidatus Contendobacter sp.]